MINVCLSMLLLLHKLHHSNIYMIYFIIAFIHANAWSGLLLIYVSSSIWEKEIFKNFSHFLLKKEEFYGFSIFISLFLKNWLFYFFLRTPRRSQCIWMSKSVYQHNVVNYRNFLISFIATDDALENFFLGREQSRWMMVIWRFFCV